MQSESGYVSAKSEYVNTKSGYVNATCDVKEVIMKADNNQEMGKHAQKNASGDGTEVVVPSTTKLVIDKKKLPSLSK